MGFLACMLMAKFGTPISIDRLLSPFLNEIIQHLVEELEGSGIETSGHVDAVVSRVSSSIIDELGPRAGADALTAAFYPAVAPKT